MRGSHHPDLALTLNNLGNVLFDIGKKEEALHSYREALSILQKTLGEQHPMTSTVKDNFARATTDSGQSSTKQ